MHVQMTSRDCDAVGLVCEGCKQTSRFDAGEGFEQVIALAHN